MIFIYRDMRSGRVGSLTPTSQKQLGPAFKWLLRTQRKGQDSTLIASDFSTSEHFRTGGLLMARTYRFCSYRFPSRWGFEKMTGESYQIGVQLQLTRFVRYLFNTWDSLVHMRTS